MAKSHKDPFAENPKLAEIVELAKSDPKAAVIAMRRYQRAHAPSVALLNDLDVSETTEAIEGLEKLDAEAALPVTNRVTTEDAERIEPSPPAKIRSSDEARKDRAKLLELVRAWRSKFYDGVVIPENDPLATEKKKAARTLKKVGLKLDALPGDWETLPRLSKIPGERSRQNELYKIGRAHV